VSIEFSDLSPRTATAAHFLLTRCPWVQFTSGYRPWAQQAHAMAVNVAATRDWLGLVYHREPQLQAWVDAHPEVRDVDSLSAGLLGVLAALPDDLRNRFAHPARRAFDLAVPSLERKALTTNVINSLPFLQLFLTHEGGLEIWHCQFVDDDILNVA